MMHSDKLANPLHPATKAHRELTSKRKKVDDDHVAIARSEFIAGVYFDETSVSTSQARTSTRRSWPAPSCRSSAPTGSVERW